MILEFDNVDSGGTHSGYFVKFKIPCKSAHGRYTAMSAPNANDYSTGFVLYYFLPQRGVVSERTAV